MRAAEKDTALFCVRAAIGRIEEAHGAWLQEQQNPTSGEADRWKAKDRLDARVADFGYQWENVKFILEDR